MERGKARRTAGSEELGTDGSKTSSFGGNETLPAPVDASLYEVIGVGGMHGSFVGESRSRLFPDSLYLFIHDGALHRHIARSFWLRIWLLFGAFLSVSIVFLVLLAPAIVCGRAVYLARAGRLADLGHLPWYVPFLPLVFLYTSGYELLLYIAWQHFRETDTQNFGPTYRFPVLYICVNVIEHCIMWLLSIGMLKISR